MKLYVVSPHGPTPAEAVELAAKLGTYALELCERVIPGHSAVMLFRDAVHALTDGAEDLSACREAPHLPLVGERTEGD